MILDYMLANAPLGLALLTAAALLAAGLALAWRALRGRR